MTTPIHRPQDSGPKVPSVVVPGFMKAGTTTIYAWLSSQPEFSSNSSKEPNFSPPIVGCRTWRNTVESWAMQGEIRSMRRSNILTPVLHTSSQAGSLRSIQMREIIIGFRDPVDSAHLAHPTRRSQATNCSLNA